jgi:hypothetical protein
LCASLRKNESHLREIYLSIPYRIVYRTEKVLFGGNKHVPFDSYSLGTNPFDSDSLENCSQKMLNDPLVCKAPFFPGYSLQNERPKTTDNDSNDYIR